MFNLFKHKKESEPNTYDGIVITDEEFNEMIRPKCHSFISDEVNDINKMIERLKKMGM